MTMHAGEPVPETGGDPSATDRSMVILQYAAALLAIIAAVLLGAIR